MSIRMLFLLQDVQRALDETFSSVIHQSSLTKRQHVKLLAENLVEHLSASAGEAKRKGHRLAQKIAVESALLASRQLTKLADKIEQKAQAIKQGD